MIECFDSQFLVPSQTTVSLEMKDIFNRSETRIREKISVVPGIVSLTSYVRSSPMYRGYLSLTMHWIDNNWCEQNFLSDCARFPTPHNGETKSSILFYLLLHWKILGKVKAITTNNASYMVSAISKLNVMLSTLNNTSRTVVEFHVRCITHEVRLALVECVKDDHEKSTKYNRY